jgi:hypothetical protein
MKKGDDARKKERWRSGNVEMKIEAMSPKQEKVGEDVIGGLTRREGGGVVRVAVRRGILRERR